MNKISVVCLLAVVWPVFGGAPLRPGVNTDAELSAKLIGTWTREEPSSSADKTFAPDGTATGFIQDYDGQGNATDRIEFKSKWKVEKGQLVGEVIASSNPDALPVGGQFSDTILSVSDERFVFLEGDTPVVRMRKH